MFEDYEYRIQREYPSLKIHLHQISYRNQALHDIEEILDQNDKRLSDFPPMESLDYSIDICETNSYIFEHLNFDKKKTRRRGKCIRKNS